MHFSKLAPFLFAAIATAAPAPVPQLTVDVGQVQQFANSVSAFASNTAVGLADIQNQASALESSLTGDTAVVLQQGISELEAAGRNVQEASARLVEALNSLTGSFQETEQSAAELLASALTGGLRR